MEHRIENTRNDYISLVEQLNHQQKIMFVLLCCERLLPNYIYFSNTYNWGEPDELRKILDIVWEYLYVKKAIELKHWHDICERNAPDMDDFGSMYGSFALDSTSTIYLLLNQIENDSVEAVLRAAILSTNTIDMYIQETNNIDPNIKDAEEIILQHPLMQQELKWLRETIELIKNTDTTDTNAIKEFEKNYKNLKVSNIGLK